MSFPGSIFLIRPGVADQFGRKIFRPPLLRQEARWICSSENMRLGRRRIIAQAEILLSSISKRRIAKDGSVSGSRVNLDAIEWLSSAFDWGSDWIASINQVASDHDLLLARCFLP